MRTCFPVRRNGIALLGITRRNVNGVICCVDMIPCFTGLYTCTMTALYTSFTLHKRLNPTTICFWNMGWPFYFILYACPISVHRIVGFYFSFVSPDMAALFCISSRVYPSSIKSDQAQWVLLLCMQVAMISYYEMSTSTYPCLIISKEATRKHPFSTISKCVLEIICVLFNMIFSF